MRKSEVDFHGRDGAAVNVKLYHWKWPELETVAADFTTSPEMAREFSAWWAKQTDEQKQEWADIAISDGWNTLTDEARNIWPGQKPKVYSAWRSSGWAVVEIGGHPFTPEDVAGWDAIALGRWATFAKRCRETCSDLPYQAVWQAYANGFEPWYEAREVQRNHSFYYDVPGPVEVQA